MRHPERYGPRPADPTMGEFQGQSRARGLTRAILDTFPVIKFSRMPVTNRDFGTGNIVYPKPADEESGSERESTNGASVEMSQLSPNRVAQGRPEAGAEPEVTGSRDILPALTLPNIPARQSDEIPSSPGAGPSRPPISISPTRATVVGSRNAPRSPETEAAEGRVNSDVIPDSIGRDTCPICIVDFEDGDDLRVLPCEGRHVFHQACVDQWLLELSSSCPLCRHGESAVIPNH